MMKTDSRTIANSPLDWPRLQPGTTVVLGGRLAGNEDAPALADAFCSVPLLDFGAPHALGSLLQVRGVVTPQGLAVLKVLWSGVGSEDRSHATQVHRGLAARIKAFTSIHQWFSENHFIEVDTPQRVNSPGLDVHLRAFSSDGKFLITSPEYHMKRLLAGGYPRIYQLSHCFRAEERGTWHNSEFMMLEWYRAFAELESMVEDTEQLIARIATDLAGQTQVNWQGRTIDFTPPLTRMTVAQAFETFANVGSDEVYHLAEHEEELYFRLLVDRVEPALAGQDKAVVLTHFPSSQASLARITPDDPRTCERFEIYAAGVELCNGFGELTDPVEQRTRLLHDAGARQALGLASYPIDERFLAALERGMPPSAGNALGVDRLVALCSGAACIQDVMAFPDGEL